jgi:CRISPR-associated exonuclease Cas4
MFPEEDLLPISALQHLLFCERQCALIHVERLWAENSLTREGRHLHEKADSGRGERRPGVRVARGLLLRSFNLGLFGKADVVEFRHEAGGSSFTFQVSGFRSAAETRNLKPETCSTTNQQLTTDSSFIPFPIEYKRGKPKKDGSDLVQLCAQALCLEEMLGVAVPAGALFYGKTRRRMEVTFDGPTRQLTLHAIARLHELIASRLTPPAAYEAKKCDRCSLRFLCLPRALPPQRSASGYLRRAMAAAVASGGPDSE